MAPPQYGGDERQHALIELLLKDNDDVNQRKDLIYARGKDTDDAAPLPDIDWQSRPTRAFAAAAAAPSGNEAQEFEMAEKFANAAMKATHLSDAWNKRIIGFYLVYCQFMAMYTTVPFSDYFVAETLLKHAIPYLVIRAIKTKGIDDDRIKARTLITWMDGLINGIWQYAHQSRSVRTSAAKEVLFKHGLAGRIRAKVDQLIRVLGLSKVLREKRILDLPDLLLLIDSALYDTRFLPSNRFAVIQFIMTWCIILYTGLRPMSLAASNPRYMAAGYYMRLRNIKIFSNGASDWTVIVNATELKSHVAGLQLKDLKFELRSVKKTHNIMFCAATLVVLYLWLRGAFPQYKTLRELWDTTDSELVILSTMRDEPFLLAGKEGGKGLQPGKPAQAQQISKSLSYHAHVIFVFAVTAYALRRGLAMLLVRVIGERHAAIVLGHKEAESNLSTYYAPVTAELDLVGIVTNESGLRPDKPGMYLDTNRRISPAMHAILRQQWWSALCDAPETARPAGKKAYGKNGENVILKPEEREGCKPVDVEQEALAKLNKFWACFKPNGVNIRDKANANRLWKGIATGKYKLKAEIDLETAKTYHAEGVEAQDRFVRKWADSRRALQKKIAREWLAKLESQPPPTVTEVADAAAILRQRNKDAIARLVARIPKDTAEEDNMTEAQMTATLDNAFQRETDDLGDVVDEFGCANPLPRSVLNKKFATLREMDEIEETFSKAFLVLDEYEDEDEGEQPLLVDGDGDDDGIDDDGGVDVLSDDVIAVRRELMELAATPILCQREGRPIPGDEMNTFCVDCDTLFKDLRAYRVHRRWRHSEWSEFTRAAKDGSRWKCSRCNRFFKNKTDFVEHALGDCPDQERNNKWYAVMQEYYEGRATLARERYYRDKAEEETGPEALEMVARETLPDDISDAGREAFMWALSALPSAAEAHEKMMEARQVLDTLDDARRAQLDGAMGWLKFDVNAVMLARALS